MRLCRHICSSSAVSSLAELGVLTQACLAGHSNQGSPRGEGGHPARATASDLWRQGYVRLWHAEETTMRASDTIAAVADTLSQARGQDSKGAQTRGRVNAALGSVAPRRPLSCLALASVPLSSALPRLRALSTSLRDRVLRARWIRRAFRIRSERPRACARTSHFTRDEGLQRGWQWHATSLFRGNLSVL